jgi:hypothetical protein
VQVSLIPAGATDDAAASTKTSRRFAAAGGEFPSKIMSSTAMEPTNTIAAVHTSVVAGAEPEQVTDKVSHVCMQLRKILWFGAKQWPTNTLLEVYVQLESIVGLQEALNNLESMIMHNKHIDKMLLYKGMQPLEEMLDGWTLRTGATAPVPVQALSDQGEVPCRLLPPDHTRGGLVSFSSASRT